MAGGGKNKLEYVKQQEPKFLRDFKTRTNFKEGATVETKRRKDEVKQIEDDDREDREDEKPVVCVLKDGDLTEEDYENYCKHKKEQEGDNASNSEGKIMFKKPMKRTNEGNVKDSKTPPGKKAKGKETKSLKSKKSDNKKLLSFNDEEDY